VTTKDEGVQNANIPDTAGQDNRPHIFVRTEAGVILKLDLPLQEAVRDRIARGQIVRVKNLNGDPFKGDASLPDEAEALVPTVPTEQPAADASKQEWVTWATAEAIRRGITVTVDDLQVATKQDLIERFGTPGL